MPLTKLAPSTRMPGMTLCSSAWHVVPVRPPAGRAVGKACRGVLQIARHSACCGSPATAGGHSHDHSHDHHDHHHHHYTETFVSQGLKKLGLLQLAESMEHSATCRLWAVVGFAVSLLLKLQVISQLFPNGVAPALQTASLVLTYILIGLPQAVESICLAAAGQIDTHVLMALAAFGTLYLGMAHEGALLLLLFQLSHTLEESFTAKAQGSLTRLFANLPDKAMLVDIDSTSGSPQLASTRPVLADKVEVGQHVLVKAGEEVPLDGTITWGSANLSLQHISGESIPVKMSQGEDVPAGAMNLDGLLVVRVSASVNESTPARIARMAAEAQATKPRISRLLTAASEVWSKAVVAATIATMVGLVIMDVPLLGPGGAFYRAMGVLTAGSPCAVVLVPLAYVCAVATITRRGVLLRSAAALDSLATCNTVALDKTGTITSGFLSLTQAEVVTLSTATTSKSYAPATIQLLASTQPTATESMLSMDDSNLNTESATAVISQPVNSKDAEFGQQAIRYAVALSRASNHPVSQAMVRYGEQLLNSQNGLAPAQPGEVSVSDLEQVPGMGVKGVCSTGNGQQQHMVYFGSLGLIRSALPDGPLREQLDRVGVDRMEMTGARAVSALLVQPTDADSQPSSTEPIQIALFSFEDQVAPGVRQAVKALQQGRWRRPGTRVQHNKDRKSLVMLTGDHARVAQQVAKAVGIDDWRAGMRPEHKLDFVRDYERQAASGSQSGLVMMGDGINDAPALAAARVGVAVASTPSDLVASAADIIILNGKGVANLPWLYAVAHKTQTVIRQNLILAFSAVVAATLPTVAGVFPLWLAVLLHEGSTLLVALNSLRLLLDPGTRTLPAALAGANEAIRDLFASAAASNDHHDHHHHHHHHDHHDHHHHDHHGSDDEHGNEQNHHHQHTHTHSHHDSHANGTKHEHKSLKADSVSGQQHDATVNSSQKTTNVSQADKLSKTSEDCHGQASSTEANSVLATARTE